jgi:hypothetical protein
MVAEDETEAAEASAPEDGGPIVDTPFGPMRAADVEQMMAMAQATFGMAQERAAAGPVRGDGQPGV